MDGERIRDYWLNEVQALLQTYRQFETLIPATKRKGAGHTGEDGRFVEELLREYLSRYLPKGLEVFTGFILRPSVKTGKNSRERKMESDCHSTQLDIIVFDSFNYPVFQKFGNNVIVPPEGVIAIISVKKSVCDEDIKNECQALFKAASLCQTMGLNNSKIRGPYLALVSMQSTIKKVKPNTLEWIFDRIRDSYKGEEEVTFDKLVGFIGTLGGTSSDANLQYGWSIFKKRPFSDKANAEIDARYVVFNHKENESHLGFQFLITGILSVFYDETRRNIKRPGYTAFPSGRKHDKELGKIKCKSIR